MQVLNPDCFTALVLFYPVQFVHVFWKSSQSFISSVCRERLPDGSWLCFIFRCLGGVWLLLNRVTLSTHVITDLTSFSVKLLTACSTSYICITNYSCLGAEPCLCPHCLNILCFSSVVPFVKYIWIPSLSSSLFVVPTSFVICRFKNSLRFHSSILKTKV